MSTITARSIRRRSAVLPGIRRGTRRPSWYTKKWTLHRLFEFLNDAFGKGGK